MSNYKQKSGSYRDTIGTMDAKGGRKWVFAKKPKGKWYMKRTYVSWFLLAIFFALPFIKVDGNQFFLLNILERKFVLFGFPFFPQDFHLFVIAMITMILFLVLFTVIYGRIFCGWICPQTIFLEMIFRKVEFFIEGDRPKQIKLDKQSWDSEKIRKKASKWLVFAIISLIVTTFFMFYIIGKDVYLDRFANFSDNITFFTGQIILTIVFYFVFAWFREQACIVVCPYGRLQGVMMDLDTIAVSYDYKRGESTNGRSKFRKNEDRKALGKGDCIDCNQCVLVCPTGIDIRDGAQMECVNCTACIDSCDDVMDRIGYPKGLIRYASEREISEQKEFAFTIRMKAYTAVLVILVGVLGFLMTMRNSVEAIILSLPGQSYQELDSGIRNFYTYEVINKTTNDLKFKFVLKKHKGKIEVMGNKGDIIAEKNGAFAKGMMFIDIENTELNTSLDNIEIDIISEGKIIDTFDVNFRGPLK